MYIYIYRERERDSNMNILFGNSMYSIIRSTVTSGIGAPPTPAPDIW